MHTRRDIGRLALGTAAVAALPASRLFAVPEAPVESVRLGATTYSLRDLPRVPGKDNIADLIKPLQDAGVKTIDLWSYNTEPAGPNTGPGAPPPPAVYPIKIKVFTPEEIAAAMKQARDLLRQFRLGHADSKLGFTPNHYQEVRSKFDAAGIAVTSYSVKYDDSFTDPEIEATFQQAKTLGAKSISVPGSAAVMKRLTPFAEKHAMNIGVADFNLASSLPSKRFRINVDIGAITAANGSPVAWIQENYDSIGQVLITDRRRNKGANEQWGQGDTPVEAVLKLIKDKTFTFPVLADYEYIGLGTPAEELARCMDYMRDAVS
jgi:sugar phosphate isomerase/epimerase